MQYIPTCVTKETASDMPSHDDSDNTSRYWGKYRGTVVNPVDLGLKGRITVLVTVGGVPLTVVAEACTPYAGPLCGLYAIPPAGAGVFVEFIDGNLDDPVYTGCWWREGEVLTMLSPDLPPPDPATAPFTIVLRTPFARLKMNTVTGEATLESLMPPATPALPTKVSVSATGVEATYGLSSIKIDPLGVQISGMPFIKLN